MTPEEYCQEKTGGSGSSFYYSFLFLPPDQRRAITALYAFCREVDDVVDECREPDIARAKLAWWRNEIENLYSDKAEHPVGRALQPYVGAYKLEKAWFHEIVSGMEMDLVKTRYRTFDELRGYCYRVASVVGLLSASIFGYRHEATLAYASDLGLAFQLINIIRDVGEDAARGRIYLPLDDLARFRVEPGQLLKGLEDENFVALMKFQGDRARELCQQAIARLPAADRPNQMPGLIMAAVYLATLKKMNKDGFRVLRSRTSLTPVHKLWIAWRTARRERRLSKSQPRP